MEQQDRKMQFLAGMLLALVAMLFSSSALAQPRPVIVTLIDTDPDACTAEFGNNNCGGIGVNGDICVADGDVLDPTKVTLKFILPGPSADFVNMIIRLEDEFGDLTCPSDYDEDFPDFNSSCIYTPTSPGSAVSVDNENVVERTWEYWITVIPGANCGPVLMHPVIDNGGGNAAAGDS